MATNLQNQPTTQPRATKIDQFVGHQLTRTSQQVRAFDLAAGLVTMVAYILTFFVAVSIVDAWVWSLTVTARLCTLVLFVGGLAFIAWHLLRPSIFGRINPLYAAKMIEESKPGFKNSLLNYLSLKRDQKTVHRAILNEVSKRAATDLSQVSIDAAVDKSNVIRVGFLLVGLVAATIAYIVFSPINPLPTVLRILSPTADIARPSAVQIDEIEPRDTSVFFGSRQPVSARVLGVDENDEVRLIYSSKDGQIIDASLTLKNDGPGNTYSAVLETGPAGIQQDLTYKIVAGDGVTADYSISVRTNPSIAINSIKITPPPYTKLPERIIEGHGEVQAVEGSSIEVQATANLPIEIAYLVPLLAIGDDATKSEYRELRTISMEAMENQAKGRFLAELNSNRDRPRFTHYKIKFRSPDDHTNENPNIYPIRVIADLPPDIEIVEPRKTELSIPVNRPMPVEIFASDPDYALSSIHLRIKHKGEFVLDKNLPLDSTHQATTERVSVKTQWTPAELGLKPGDQVIMFATAADNRVAIHSLRLDPNPTNTENYSITIGDPVAANEQEQQSDQSNDSKNPNDQQPDRQEQPHSSNSQSPESDGSRQQNSTDDSQPSSESGRDEDNGEAQQDPSQESDDPEGSQHSESGDQQGANGEEQQGNQQGANGEEQQGNQQGANGEEQQGNQQGANGEEQQQSRGRSADQPNNGQQRDGAAGGNQNSTDNEETDGTTNSDGGQPNQNGSGGNQQSNQSGNPTGEGQGDGQSTQDSDLQSGKRESLDRNASERQQFDRLKEYFDNQPSGQKESDNDPASSNESSSSTRQDSGAQPKTGEAKAEDDRGEVGRHQSEAQPSQPDPSTSDSNSESTGEADGSRTPPNEKSPGSPDQQSSDQERARDGNPEQPAAGGQESEQGRPAETDSDSGTTSGEQTGRDERGNAESSDSSQASASSGSSEASDTAAEDSNPSTGNGQDPSNGGNDDSNPNPSKSQDDSQATQNANGQSSKPEPGESQGNDDQGNGNQAEPSKSSSSESGTAEKTDSQSSGAHEGAPSDSSGKRSNDDRNRPPQNSDEKQGGNSGAAENQPQSASDQKDLFNADDPNLNYSKKITDLVLNQLEDQKYEPDQELLDDMNWTQQDLERFLRQWQEMKTQAERGDQQAQRVYQEALQSLGYRSKSRARVSQNEKDKAFQLNEDGAEERIPVEYEDKFRSFLKRRNRTKRK